MTEREVLKLALEALQSGDYWKGVEAVNAIREALAQPEQEPVAWLCRRKTGGSLFVYTEEQLSELGYGNISVPPFDKIAPLYTTPPNRKPLTDEELAKILGFWEHTTTSTRVTLTTLARAIEAAHGITGEQHG